MKIDKEKFFVACAKNKLTFLDAVKKAGLSRNIVVSINKGKNVNSKKVGMLAAALNCEPEEIILKDNSNCETKEYCLAENLKLFRDIKGISQKEVADYLGITQAAYSKYEVGETEPKIPTLIKLAKYFETDLNQLICSNHNKEILKGVRT